MVATLFYMITILLFQLFINEFFQLLTTETSLKDFTLLVDNNSMWNAVHTEMFGNSILPSFKVAHLYPGDVELLGSSFPGIAIFVKRYAYDIQTFILILAIQLQHERHFLTTRATP